MLNATIALWAHLNLGAMLTGEVYEAYPTLDQEHIWVLQGLKPSVATLREAAGSAENLSRLTGVPVRGRGV